MYALVRAGAVVMPSVYPLRVHELAQAGPASSVVSQGVVGVASRCGLPAAGIGAGGMPDLDQVPQPGGGSVRSRLPGMITAAVGQERKAEDPGPIRYLRLRLGGRARSRTVMRTVCRSVVGAACRSVVRAAWRSVTWAA